MRHLMLLAAMPCALLAQSIVDLIHVDSTRIAQARLPPALPLRLRPLGPR